MLTLAVLHLVGTQTITKNVENLHQAIEGTSGPQQRVSLGNALGTVGFPSP